MAENLEKIKEKNYEIYYHFEEDSYETVKKKII